MRHIWLLASVHWTFCILGYQGGGPMSEFTAFIHFLAEALDQPLPLWGVFFLWALLFLQIARVSGQLSELIDLLKTRDGIERRFKGEPRIKGRG